MQHHLEVLILPTLGCIVQRIGQIFRRSDKIRGSFGTVLRDPGHLHQHGLRVRVKDARDDRVVFTGMAVGGQIGERPLSRLAIIGDHARPAIGIDEESKLLADFTPARVGVADEGGRPGTQVLERHVATYLHAIRMMRAVEHRGYPGYRHQVAAAYKLVVQRDEILVSSRPLGRHFRIDTIDRYVSRRQQQRRRAAQYRRPELIYNSIGHPKFDPYGHGGNDRQANWD